MMDQTQSDWMSTTKRITWQYFVWCSAWGRGQGAGRVGGGGQVLLRVYSILPFPLNI